MDSIVDIVSVACCLDQLGIDRVILTKLCEGTGTVRCQHGVLPVPVPAVTNILREYGIPVEILPIKGELVTPTGAAIAAALKTDDTLPEKFVIEKTGYGAGKRTYQRAGILRAMLIRDVRKGPAEEGEGIWKLECNVDDCSGEALGFVMEQLFEAGMRDVHFSPVYMKKNRPGWQVNVICDEELIGKAEEILFCNTTTIGIRRYQVRRSILKRESKEVQTPLGSAVVKVCHIGGEKRCYPEYESVASLARRHGKDFPTVYEMVRQLAESI